MPRGGKQPGAGRKLGVKNKATIEREIAAAAQIDLARKGQKKLAVAEMEKALTIAEGFAGLNQPNPVRNEKGQLIRWDGGDVKLFGEWFDRWVFCLKELAKYQSPQIKAMEAPTPPPDPKDVDQRARKRFGLRIFEGGRPMPAPSAPVDSPPKEKKA